MAFGYPTFDFNPLQKPRRLQFALKNPQSYRDVNAGPRVVPPRYPRQQSQSPYGGNISGPFQDLWNQQLHPRTPAYPAPMLPVDETFPLPSRQVTGRPTWDRHALKRQQFAPQAPLLSQPTGAQLYAFSSPEQDTRPTFNIQQQATGANLTTPFGQFGNNLMGALESGADLAKKAWQNWAVTPSQGPVAGLTPMPGAMPFQPPPPPAPTPPPPLPVMTPESRMRSDQRVAGVRDLMAGGYLTRDQALSTLNPETGAQLGIPPQSAQALQEMARIQRRGDPELQARFGAYEAARANVSPAGFPINAGQPFTRYNAQTGQTEVVQPMAPIAPGGAPPMAEAPIRSMGANTEARLQGALSKNDWDRLSFDAKNAGVSPSKRTLEQMTPEEQMRIARSPYPASIAALNEGPLRADAKKTYQEKQRWDLYRQWGRKLGYSEEDMANVTADERDKFIQAMGEQRQQDYQLSKKEQRDQSKQMRVLRAQQEDYANRLRQGKVVPTTDEWLQMNPQSELAQKMMLQDRAFQQKMIENEQIINAGKYAQQSQYRRLAQEALRTGNQELADRYAQLANMEESSRGMGGVVGAPAAPEQDAATVGRANAITAMKDAWGGSMWRTRGGAESKLRNVIRAMKSNPNFTPEQYSLFLKELANTPEGQEMLNATNLAPDIRQFLYGQVQFDKKGRLLTLPRDYTVPSAPIRTGV